MTREWVQGEALVPTEWEPGSGHRARAWRSAIRSADGAEAAVGVLKSIVGEDGNVGEKHLRAFNEQMGTQLSLPRLRRLKIELGL
ncbi:MAG: hypothetical protein CTY20_00720 [Hyphomicrobium sp.]|nr:MAG: hypothetical protein CTY20_00720 [Hyphomicrobium sp.]